MPNHLRPVPDGTDGSEQTLLTRGSSATWSPDGKSIAFHASASGTGTPILGTPGAATTDSDIFLANVDDLLEGVSTPRNITNTADAIDDDPTWSPDGQKIAFTRKPVTDNPNNAIHAEIYVINVDGTGEQRLTYNLEEERSPDWSPDGHQLVFSCRKNGPDFEICLMHADGTPYEDGTLEKQVTDNSVGDLTSSWSPDSKQIVFHRTTPPTGLPYQLWMINADGKPFPDGTQEQQLTFPPATYAFPSWGELRVHEAGGEHPATQ